MENGPIREWIFEDRWILASPVLSALDTTNGVIENIQIGTLGPQLSGAPVVVQANRIDTLKTLRGGMTANITVGTIDGGIGGGFGIDSLGFYSGTITADSVATQVQVAGTVADSTGLAPNSVVRVRRLEPGAEIRVPSGGLRGQVVVNAPNTDPLSWLGNVVVGTTTLGPVPAYGSTSTALGGGAVGLAPYRIHRADSFPAPVLVGGVETRGRISAQGNPMGPAYMPFVRYYGPVVASQDTSVGGLVHVQRSPRTVTPTWVAAPASQFAFSIPDDGAFDRRVLIAGAGAGRLPTGLYRIVSNPAALRCGLVDGPPGVSDAVVFEFEIEDGCGAADIANTDGDPIPDGMIDNGDFAAFFAAFFLPSSDPARLRADIANTDGEVASVWALGTASGGPDGQIDNGDFSSFFLAFFAGCESSSGTGLSGSAGSLLASLAGESVNLAALTPQELSQRLEQLRALGRPITVEDVRQVMPEVFVGGLGQ